MLLASRLILCLRDWFFLVELLRDGLLTPTEYLEQKANPRSSLEGSSSTIEAYDFFFVLELCRLLEPLDRLLLERLGLINIILGGDDSV